MEVEWRCRRCGTLLGIVSGDRLHLRYKDAQYIVCGTDPEVIAVCRSCKSVDEWGQDSGRRASVSQHPGRD